jgi:tetratricopeptide (TPR) repeat protein
MRNIFILIIIFLCPKVLAQKLALFDNPERLEQVNRIGYYIYNNEYSRADSAIFEVEKKLPGHPIIHLLRALNIAWSEMPIRTTSDVFPAHYAELQKVIESALKLQEANEKNQEGIFFEMSARGLLTEYYAREGIYLKALGEARKMYALAKAGFDFLEENNEFLFSTGLYNYFREMYPERHPIYKPFVWVFKSGDIDEGLMQLHRATQEAKLTKIEASLYLSYIYLRYENKPLKALSYLEELVKVYPNNNYFKSKLLECLMVNSNYTRAYPFFSEMLLVADPYYKMCGEVNMGIYQEKHLNNYALSEKYYYLALNTGKHYTDKGLYFRSLAYIGLGRISKSRGDLSQAKEFFENVLEIDENDALNEEAKSLIKEVK